MVFLFPAALGPVNWLSARGLLQGRAAWTAANNWGAFVAVLIPTTVAAWCEGQPVGSFGLPWRGGADGYVPRASPGASVPRAYRNPLQLTAFLVTGLLALELSVQPVWHVAGRGVEQLNDDSL